MAEGSDCYALRVLFLGIILQDVKLSKANRESMN